MHRVLASSRKMLSVLTESLALSFTDYSKQAVDDCSEQRIPPHNRYEETTSDKNVNTILKQNKISIDYEHSFSFQV